MSFLMPRNELDGLKKRAQIRKYRNCRAMQNAIIGIEALVSEHRI